MLVRSTQGIGQYESFRGYLFEELAHEAISEGGVLSGVDLETKLGMEVTFPKRVKKGFKRVTEVKGQHYWRPDIKNSHRSTRSCQRKISFQMTVSTSHGINKNGLDALKDVLDNNDINFYFVTPKERVRTFRKAGLEGEWTGKIKQKVIGIDFEYDQIESWRGKHKIVVDDEGPSGTKKARLGS